AVLPALAVTLPALAASKSHHSSAKVRTASYHVASSHATRGHHAVRTAAVVHHETASIGPERATAIQTALIHAGYLSGEPTGVWDSDSVAAMHKMQDDNGWQTKCTPDSGALARLGLGS